MTYPQKPTIHPETGPTALGVRVDNRDSRVNPASGVIIFNQRPLQPQTEIGAIAGAIANGDTVKERIRSFEASVYLFKAA